MRRSCSVIMSGFSQRYVLPSNLAVRLQVAATPEDGIAMAQDAQRSGRAADTLRKWIDVSQEALSAETA